MFKSMIITPLESEWASAVLIVPKPDGGLPLYIYYRRRNALKRYSYPLLSECHAVKGATNHGRAALREVLDLSSESAKSPLILVESVSLVSSNPVGSAAMVDSAIYWDIRRNLGIQWNIYDF